MKKILSKVGALALALAFIIGSPVSVYAADLDRSYTYNYDYWGDVQDSPDFYSVCKVFTAKELGLDKFTNPTGIYVHDDSVFLMDSGNNRIIEFKRESRESLTLVRIIDSIKGSEINTFSSPTDMAISEEGNYFIADKGNARVVKVDKDFNYLMEFTKPGDNTLGQDLVFAPNKIVVDDSERVYCIATGVNKGLIKYEADGSFNGFVGATPVSYDFIQVIWKKIASQEQLAKMVAFVPTEYDNIYMDDKGFIYACTGSVAKEDLKAGKVDAIRKLNLLGNDILVRNGVYYDGEFPVYGDIYMGEGGGHKGPSYFSDVTVFDNEAYICLDKNRGRLFCYDNQGRMLFICGGNGNMDGYFRNPLAIDHMGYDLYVVDQLDCAITLFTLTDFGELVFSAMDHFDLGEYEESQAAWEKVIDLNGNYDLAYIGLGRSYLRQKEYKTAMDYFKLKYDDENYSKAYQQYRKEWVEENLTWIVIVILALFLIPMGIGRVKKVKFEINTADIFNNKE